MSGETLDAIGIREILAGLPRRIAGEHVAEMRARDPELLRELCLRTPRGTRKLVPQPRENILFDLLDALVLVLCHGCNLSALHLSGS